MLAISLVVFFCALVFFPYKICLNVNVRYDEDLKKLVSLQSMSNKLSIKVFNIIPIFKVNFVNGKKNKNTKKKKTNFFEGFKFKILKKLFKRMTFNEFAFSLGFNLDNYVINSNINAAINSILCIAINDNIKRFNLKRLYYQTYTSTDIIVLNFSCIISLNLVNTIKVLVSEYIKYKRENNRVVKFEKRSDIYGRTSN